ncbi:MAG: TonB-dependent receptor [Bacteroides sp.]|jgi:hypothetical protein|nr:TonB-dependent receptor [Bacteroides sp.]MCI1682988.1 TonB-dependent receptor [Bacteroides sp.]
MKNSPKICRGMIVALLASASIFAHANQGEKLLFSQVQNCDILVDNKTRLNIKGRIFTKNKGKIEAVPYATIQLKNIAVGVISDNDGKFELTNVIPDTYTMKVSCLGYEDYVTILKLTDSIKELQLELKVADFSLDEIVVTAQTSKAGASTASTISKMAMEHMQSVSLSDVMELLPGADISSYKADLQGVSTHSIRGGASFGTSVVLDGAPLSSNANMQIMSSAIGGSVPGTRSVTPNVGTDLRTITTDNIESVEVIRGVASAAYGDMGGGAIIINSKVGRQPLSIKFNTNPNVYSVAASHGLFLGGKKGFLNYGLDYAYSVADPRESYDTYNRYTMRLAYSNPNLFHGLLNSTTSFNLYWTKDKGEPNPDDPNDFTTSNEKDLMASLNTKGTFNLSKGWLKNISYVLQGSYTYRHSFFADNGTNADVAYSYSKIDGTVLSSIKNGHVYDTDGNELTNYGNGATNEHSWITPAEYFYQYDVFGKEINTYVQIKANLAGKLGITSHRIVSGIDFKADGNVGDGKVFDMDNPPYRSASYTYQTQRERPYKNIPFLIQLSAFAEETFRMNIANRQLEIVAGARYDYVRDCGGSVAPRLNASFEILPSMLSVRGAYGYTYKAPTLAYLYPDNAYFDMTNFNNALQSNIPDAQKFQLITTHVYPTENHDLKMAKQVKSEIGLDFRIKKMMFSVTAYKDYCHNGYSLDPILEPTTFKQYGANEYPEDGTTLPTLKEISNKPYLLSYTRPGNSASYERIGVEFDFNFGYIDAIRTQFSLNGQWYHHKSWINGVRYFNYVADEGSNMYGVYNSKNSYGVFNRSNTITNLIVTHNIPSIGFVVSLTGNVNWNYKGWTSYADDDTTPIGYITTDGKYHDFNSSWADPSSEKYNEYLSILRNEDNGAVTPNRKVVEPAYNPVLCMNVNITKQFKLFDVSFFANNLFRSTPLQKLVKSPGNYIRRNDETFFFGLQLTARIK